jgi:NAD(P)-dependent dehydrogenase (short-subunit alcohol dehydrogenase family)
MTSVTEHHASHLAPPIQCDHTDDAQVESACARIHSEQGQLDLLANSVWGGYEQMVENGEFTWPRPFWQQPMFRRDAMLSAGVRAYFVASRVVSCCGSCLTLGEADQ